MAQRPLNSSWPSTTPCPRSRGGALPLPADGGEPGAAGALCGGLWRGVAGARSTYLNTREHDAYIQGNDGRFRPEDSLSRAEAVAMLARLSVDEQGNLLYSGAPGTGGFSDVKRGTGTPLCGLCQALRHRNGYLDGTFRPEQPVSRAELVKLIASYFTVEGGTSPFPDVLTTGRQRWSPLRRRRAGCRAIRTAPSGPTRR
ncbi:S-layer homology domain-containing protein [Flavonifractor plautii]|nr:S-layer homology domain-containing protein [Flavonifractor plautii]